MLTRGSTAFSRRAAARFLSTAAREPVPACAVFEAALPDNLGTLFVGITDETAPGFPGNGGLRIWNYANLGDARDEVRARARPARA
jgi:hypothetical protein